MKQISLVLDRWCSEVLERPTYRLDLDASGASITDDALASGLAGLPPGAFVYARIPVDSSEPVQGLVRAGFCLVETSVILEKQRNEGVRTVSSARQSVPSDEGAVVEIARTTFRYSRFHSDPQIGHELAGRLKAEWARNYFRGIRGDSLVVSEIDGRVAGFLQLLSREATLIIDLIAVAPEAQRRGVASAMIEFAEHHAHDAKVVRVGTQLHNTGSIRLYEGLGFRIASANYMLHFHKTP